MPSFMIHLLTAKMVGDTRGPLFFIGNLAPDAQNDFARKECTHLRDCPDRGAALAAIARATDPADAFAEGALLHLFTDWRWDTTQLRRYLDTVEDTRDFTWVDRYRRETALASAWLYWNCEWAPRIWMDMLTVPQKNYGNLEDITPEDIYDLLANAHEWLKNNRGPPSQFYTPELVEAFVKTTAENYMKWRMKEQ